MRTILKAVKTKEISRKETKYNLIYGLSHCMQKKLDCLIISYLSVHCVNNTNGVFIDAITTYISLYSKINIYLDQRHSQQIIEINHLQGVSALVNRSRFFLMEESTMLYAATMQLISKVVRTNVILYN